jgi:allene oxide cyclase-like protein
MRIPPPTLIAVALAGAAAAAGGIAFASGHDARADAAAGPRTLTFSEPFVGGRTRYLDVGKKGISPGDMFLTTDAPVFDLQTGKRVGTSDGMETFVSLRHQGTVWLHGTTRLRAGRIEGGGLLRHSDRRQSLPVTGGTGAYAGARGEMTVTEDRQHKRNVITVTLLP